MRAVIAALVIGMVFVGCGGGDDDSTQATANTPTTAATLAPGETPKPTATPVPASPTAGINVDKDKDDAFKALERQFKFLTDGQSSRAYDEIHPSQRALFTKEQYGACVADAARLGSVKLKLKEAYLEKAHTIPGTTEAPDALALTVDLTIDNRTDTDTFHEYKVDGKWYFVVEDAKDVKEGTC